MTPCKVWSTRLTPSTLPKVRRPFTTLGFGLGTSWLKREIQRAILKVRLGGIGKEKRTAIFPKLVFSLKRGVNLAPKDPNYDIKELAVRCATKRMYPRRPHV